MDFELSQKTQKICKNLKLTEEQLVFADLVAVGWEPADAFIMAFRKGATWRKTALKEEVDKMMDRESIKNRIAETKNILSERQKKALKQVSKKDRGEVVETAMSKEHMLYDLQLAKKDLTPGTKEWIDINKLIVDVTRMKQDEVKQDDTTVHFYLPVKYPTGCQDCLYQRCNTCKFKLAYKGE